MAAAGARAAYKTARKSEAVGENRPNIHANKSASKRARETPAICTLRSHSLSLNHFLRASSPLLSSLFHSLAILPGLTSVLCK